MNAETAAPATKEPKAKKAPKEPKAAKEVKPVVSKVEANGIVRPNAGTMTAMVWEISDAQSATAGAPAKRKEVLEAAVTANINPATAATQYGRWRKFNGLGKEVVAKPAAAEATPAAVPEAHAE